MPESAFPSRIGVGDGPGIPCRFVAADFTPHGGSALVAGHRDAGGVVYIDRWESDPAPGPTEVGQSTFTAERAGSHSVGAPRPASDFLVDLDAPPNSCTRCGIEQRDHGEDHAYAEPTDSVRLARMKSRHTKRLAASPRYELTPDLIVEFQVNTGAFTAAIVRAMEGLSEATRRMGEATRPVIESIRRQQLIAEVNQRTGERIEACRVRRASAPEDAIDWGDPLVDSDADWPARGAVNEVCAHVCGADPDHICSARADTFLQYELPSGGTRDMPICWPCFSSEWAAKQRYELVDEGKLVRLDCKECPETLLRVAHPTEEAHEAVREACAEHDQLKHPDGQRGDAHA